MSVQINWGTISNDFVASFLTNAINYVIMQQKDLLLGGFAYVDTLQLGANPPSFSFLSIDTMTDDHIVGEIEFAYHSDLLIKAQAYAPANPLQSTSRFQKRSRLHMNVAQSAAPGFINAWACVRDVQIEGTARIEYTALSLVERQKAHAEHIAQMIRAGEILGNETDAELTEKLGKANVPKGMVTIQLNSFPLKQVLLSFAFDGSVLADMVGGMVNSNLDKAKAMLAKQSYTFSLPI